MTLLFAFDIDGTLTDAHVGIEDEVLHALERLYKDGAEIIFLTGRTFSWSYPPIKKVSFPYTLGVQNGATLLHMPETCVVFKRLLSKNILLPLAQICDPEPTDVVVYSGFDNDDVCYYRKKHFDPELLDYALKRAGKINERWKAIEDFDELPFEEFSSVKCFGFDDSLQRISEKTKHLPLKMPVTFDAVNTQMRIAQGTEKDADKGQALLDYQSLFPEKEYFTIACGDDFNDIPMLQKAQVKVVMETAPESVKELADIIAPPAKELGIIHGINEALKIYDSQH